MSLFLEIESNKEHVRNPICHALYLISGAAIGFQGVYVVLVNIFLVKI